MFITAFKVSIRLNDTPSNSFKYETFKPYKYTPTAKSLFRSLSRDMTSINKSTTLPFTINHSNIKKCKDKVLPIQYNPNGTMKAIC